MLPVVVSNAGPLMVLAKLNRLRMLSGLYSRVHIAQAVHTEVVEVGLRKGHADAQTLSLFLRETGWYPQEPLPIELPTVLQKARLDRGEHDTLALALTLPCNAVLMDEHVGRNVARTLGLSVRGSLGILIAAYRCNLLNAEQLRLDLMEIARRPDIWINPDLVRRLLHDVLDEFSP